MPAVFSKAGAPGQKAPGDLRLLTKAAPRGAKKAMAQALDLNPQFLKALHLMEEGKKNLFITGKAGTGKSTLLEHFRSRSKRKPVVLAPTGVAALNVRGETIHSFFQFYIDVTPEKIRRKKGRPKNPEIYKSLKTIIIDEISMARADLLDCVDEFLRRFGPSRGSRFGGVQMIFVGDLHQLPPVVSSAERDIFSAHYKTPFFFSARVFESFEMEIIELEKIYRQRDQEFINLLGRIRANSVTDEDMALINTRCRPGFKPRADDFYITLTARNQTADALNMERLRALKGRMHKSEAFIEGDFGKEYFPTAAELKFKTGAQVMLLSNDAKKRWVNGSAGVIKSISPNKEEARISLAPKGKTVTVPRRKWDIYRFSFSRAKKAIVSELAGSFTQFPFRLAWAITIHKSQGKTFERMIIDSSHGMFASGQAYVAFSRCVSLSGIVLKAPFKRGYIRTDYRIFDFLTGSQYRKAEKEMPIEEKTKIIQRAIEEEGWLQMTYLKPNGLKSRREVKPLAAGTESYGGREFQGMRAFCGFFKSERMFRIDRILEISPFEGQEGNYTDRA